MINAYIYAGLPPKLQFEICRSKQLNNSTVKKVIKAVEFAIEISMTQCNTKSRIRELAEARHCYCYYLKYFTNLPFKQIGKMFGNRDHSTIINSCNKWEDYLSYNRTTQEIDLLIKSKMEV